MSLLLAIRGRPVYIIALFVATPLRSFWSTLGTNTCLRFGSSALFIPPLAFVLRSTSPPSSYGLVVSLNFGPLLFWSRAPFSFRFLCPLGFFPWVFFAGLLPIYVHSFLCVLPPSPYRLIWPIFRFSPLSPCSLLILYLFMYYVFSAKIYPRWIALQPSPLSIIGFRLLPLAEVFSALVWCLPIFPSFSFISSALLVFAAIVLHAWCLHLRLSSPYATTYRAVAFLYCRHFSYMLSAAWFTLPFAYTAHPFSCFSFALRP